MLGKSPNSHAKILKLPAAFCDVGICRKGPNFHAECANSGNMKINDSHVQTANDQVKSSLKRARALSDASDYKGAFHETLSAIAARQEIIKHFWAVFGNPEES
jgi:hypothetical protein